MSSPTDAYVPVVEMAQLWAVKTARDASRHGRPPCGFDRLMIGPSVELTLNVTLQLHEPMVQLEHRHVSVVL